MTEQVMAQNQEAALEAFSDSPTEEIHEEQTAVVTPDKEQASTQSSPEGSQDVAEPKEVKKETRAERRIKNLLDKLHSRDNQDTSGANQLREKTPLIKPEELESGVELPVLQERMDQRLEAATPELVNRVKNELAYEQAHQDHVKDAEEVAKQLESDPDLENYVAEQYELVNRILNPMTGEMIWAPVAKMSEVLAKVREQISSIAQKQQVSTQQIIKETIAQSAVPVGGAQKSAPKSDDFLAGFDEY